MAMSPNLATVLAAAEALSAEEQRELIDLLLAGLEDGQTDDGSPALTEAWRQEIRRRSAEYEAGQSETVTWQEVKTRWQARRNAGG